MKKLYMFKRVFLVGVIVAVTGVLTSFFILPDDTGKYEKLLISVGRILEIGHFKPKKIDDAFSRQVFKEYLLELDGNKNTFIQADVAELGKYETQIDDEIHGAPITFFYAVNTLYLQRMKQTEDYVKETLTKPFDFTVNETLQMNADSLAYPATESEREQRWYKYLKLLALERYSEMLEIQDRSKAKKDFKERNKAEIEADARSKVKEIMDKRFSRIHRPDTENERFTLLIKSITNLMDPHTDFFPPIEKRAFDERMSRKFYGIGAYLLEENNQIKINSVTSGGAAWKSGELQAGDVIVKVGEGTAEPVDITGYSMDDAIKLIRGDKDTEVRLTVKKTDGTVKLIILKRGELKIEEAYAKSAIINGKHKIGYIQLPDFYADLSVPDGVRCSKDVAKEVEKLKAENVEGIIIDIRNNGGGYLYEAIQMMGLFVKTGPVVQVKDREGNPSVLNMDSSKIIYDGPLAVLVNEYSASASEIFAAAIQDYGRGVVIGSTSTFGKGTVQQPIPVSRILLPPANADDLGSIHLTLQKYYRINGGSTQLRGVTPDVILPGYLEYNKSQEKDKPASLEWDEIPKAKYDKWSTGYSIDQLKRNSQERIGAKHIFDSIRLNGMWLASRSEKPIQLQLENYRNDQKQNIKTVQTIQRLLKLKDTLAVNIPKPDVAAIKGDKTKEDNTKSWTKWLGSDLYLNESIHVMDDMVNMRKIAKH